MITEMQIAKNQIFSNKTPGLMKKFLFYVTILFTSVNLWSQVTITEQTGWLESAYVKWTNATSADSYNVYYSDGTTTKQIDTQLIRSYGAYFRADVLGLKAGIYTITVKPVISGDEQAGTTSSSITVLAHDRSGFAFQGGHIPGAYNMDGTPKTGAVIVYVTENTKNTVSLNVTGATVNPCVGLQNILFGFKKGKDNRPLIVRLIGNITDLDTMDGGDIVIENNNNINGSITFEGVGNDAVTNGWSVRVKGMTNLEVRNLAAMNCNSKAGDDFGLQQDNDHIWIHNNEMFYGDAGGDADQVKGDGAMDVKLSTYVTISYNHFWDNGKSSLLGLSENTTAGYYITYHHNWFDHSDSRHPRVRFYSAHVYNNYYDGVSKYGAGSTEGSSVFMEGNYFRNCKYPMLTSLQGTDVWDPAAQKNNPTTVGIFSGEPGGTIKAFNNILDQDGGTNNMRFVAYGDPNPLYNIAGKISSTTDFDAYVATTRGETVPATVKSYSGANTYNNFDTDPTLYVNGLEIDTPVAGRDKTKAYSGRTGGGDLQWSFINTSDDSAYLIVPDLKALVTNYTTSISYIQGEPKPSSQTIVVTTTNAEQTVNEGAAIEPIVLKWGGDATDVSVTGLPIAGITFTRDLGTKTITITGTPTADAIFSVTTIGSTGTPVTKTGTIKVFLAGTVLDDEIHDFTRATPTPTSSTFYTIAGSMNSSDRSATYDGLTFTKCIKTDSAINIKYTTTATSTLTLVFDPTFTKTIKVNGTSYTAVGGIVTIESLPAGQYTITKGDSNFLYYIKTKYSDSLGTKENVTSPKLTLYPNPVTDQLYFSSSEQKIENVAIYSLSGALVKTISKVGDSIDVSNLHTGTYLVKVTTDQGSFTQKIIKK